MFTDTKSVNKLLQEIKILKWKDQREFPLLNKIVAIKNELDDTAEGPMNLRQSNKYYLN